MTLNFSGQQLRDDSNVLSLITNPNKYKFLDLSNNDFTSLPQEISKFYNLVKLDISQNKIQDILSLTKNLQALPSLQMLNVDIYTQEDAYIILKNLPNLTQLNGQTTYEEEYEGEQTNNQNLTNNEENKTEMNQLEEEEVQSQNCHIDTGRGSVSTLEEEEMSFIKEVEVFNNVIEQIQIIFHNQRNQFKLEFQRKVKEQIEIINKNLEIPDYLYKMTIVKSKIEIYSFIYNEIINLMLNNPNQIYQHKTGVEITLNIVRAKIKKNEHLLYEIISQLHYQIIKCQTIPYIIQTQQNKVEQYNINPITNNNKPRNLIPTNPNSNSVLKHTQNSLPIMISKKSLLLTLNDIFKYHTDINKSNFSNHIPEQSLLISMNGYLQQKYGIKSLVETWLNHIKTGITLYSPEESEINLFGKILNNNIEENAYYVYKDLKNICSDILMTFIKTNNQFKSKDYIEKIYINKIQGFLTYAEWDHILNIIFINEKNILHKNIIKFIQMKNKKDERYQHINVLNIKENKLTREEKRKIQCGIPKVNINLNILHQDLIKLLLEFQIKLREKYLHKFAEGFKKVDKDKDGVISEDEFKEMMIGFGIEFEDYDDTIEKMLDFLDPFEGNKISFSSCVKILSDETSTNEKHKMSILDIIVSNSNSNINNSGFYNSKSGSLVSKNE